ncbi:hypothetical protein AEQU2_01296 [Aequorivita lipolytica]|nr:hypothetical protein AEQU2_01296 [Aequorivita lipolytica]
MKKIFTLLFLACSFISHSQDISIKSSKSTVFKDDKKHTELLYSEGDGQGGFVTVRLYFGGFMKQPKGYYIEHYNKELNLLKETEFEIDNNTFQGLMVNDGTVYIMEAALDKEKELYKFNVLESPLADLQFSSKTLFTLAESDVKQYFGVGIGVFFINNGWSQMDSGAFGEVTFSKHKNFFAVNFDIKDKESQTQLLYVFDKGMNQIFKKEFKRNIEDKFFIYENVDVDDTTGDIFLLGKVFENESKKSKKNGKANYHYELHKINESGETQASFKTDDNFVGSLFTLRSENSISCAGFYSEKNDNRYKGVCRFNLDPTSLNVTQKSFIPFSEEFINDKYGKLKDKELRNLTLRSKHLTPNGDIVLNAEEFYITQHSMMSANGGMSTRVTYHYDDIVTVKISEEGKLVWARNINKRQATSGGQMEYLSFASTIVDDDTYLFLNCSDKIRTIRNDRLEFKEGKSMFAIKIDANGTYSYKSILKDKDAEVPFFVSQGTTTTLDGKEIVFVGRKKSKKQFLKINIK